MPDNWQNRAAVMRCDNCMAFAPKVSEDGEVRLGRCRRHAPTISGFPAVFPGDWCFDHRLDENRIGTPAHVPPMAAEVSAARSTGRMVLVPAHIDSDAARTFYAAGRDGIAFDLVSTGVPIPRELAIRYYEAGQTGEALVYNS